MPPLYPGTPRVSTPPILSPPRTPLSTSFHSPSPSRVGFLFFTDGVRSASPIVSQPRVNYRPPGNGEGPSRVAKEDSTTLPCPRSRYDTDPDPVTQHDCSCKRRSLTDPSLGSKPCRIGTRELVQRTRSQRGPVVTKDNVFRQHSELPRSPGSPEVCPGRVSSTNRSQYEKDQDPTGRRRKGSLRN